MTRKVNGYLRVMVTTGVVVAVVGLGLLYWQNRGTKDYQTAGRVAMAEIDTMAVSLGQWASISAEVDTLKVEVDTLKSQVIIVKERVDSLYGRRK